MENQYRDKYFEYKIKYLELKEMTLLNKTLESGGKKTKNIVNNNSFELKFNEILNFIEKSTNEEIKNSLNEIIKFNEFCPIILGEGAFGKAYIPETNKTIELKVGKKNINIPIIIKETKNNASPNSQFNMNIIDNVLYISGNWNITTEALIFIYI